MEGTGLYNTEIDEADEIEKVEELGFYAYIL